MDKKEREGICCVYDHELYRKDSTPNEHVFIYAENEFIEWDENKVKKACTLYELYGGRKDGIKDGWMPFELRSLIFKHDIHFSNVASFSPMSDDSILEGFLEITLPEYISLYEKKHGKMP